MTEKKGGTRVSSVSRSTSNLSPIKRVETESHITKNEEGKRAAADGENIKVLSA